MDAAVLSKNFNFLKITFSKFRHNDYRKGIPTNFLAYMIKGRAQIVSDRGSIEVEEGQLFFIPKNLGYQSYWYGEDEIQFLSFAFAELEASEKMSFELQSLDCGAELAKKVMAIETKGRKVSLDSLSRFYAVMAEVAPRLKPAAENRELERVDAVKNCIRKYPFSSLGEIAEMCAISEPYMYSLFKKRTGTTPNDYRQRVLCDMGIELLVTTDKKVEEISDMLSFSSSSYFRKVLKKQTGATPREIRKNGYF